MTYVPLWCEMCFKKPTCWNDKFSKLYIDLHLVHYLVHLLVSKNDQIAASPISTEICFTEWMLCVKHLNSSKLRCTLSSLHPPQSAQMKCALSAMHSQFSSTCVEYIEGSTSNMFWQCNKKIVAKESNNNFAAAIQCNAMQRKAKQSKAKQSKTNLIFMFLQLRWEMSKQQKNEQKSNMKKRSNKSRLLLAADLPIHFISFS